MDNQYGDIHKGENYLSNQAYSEAEDLMLGAGELYFFRDDDQNKSFHHLGNASEFTLTTDVTKVDKKSSMNHRRALMASVVTETAPTAKITLDEYNPYNLALGLFGTEGVHKQTKAKITNLAVEVTSVPGIIILKDADGNKYYNVHDVKVNPMNAVPAKAEFSGGVTQFADSLGGTIDIGGTYTGSANETIYVHIDAGVKTAGSDTLGLKFTWKEGILGTPHVETAVGGSNSETFTLGTTGLTLKFDVSGSGTANFTPDTAGAPGKPITCVPGVATFTDGKEFSTDPQTLQAGMIKINDTENIKVGDILSVDAEVDEGEFITVSGADAGKISGELLFVGDPNQGNKYVLEGWKVTIQPDGDVAGLISDGSDFSNFQLTVNFLSDYQHHTDAEYYKLTKVGVADGSAAKKGVYDPHE